MENKKLSIICADLMRHGHCICDDFLSPDLTKSLAREAQLRQKNGLFFAAGTGLKANIDGLRGDTIVWLEEADENAFVQLYLSAMHDLQTALNRQLLLNLHAFETHFAVYAAGAGYAKHLDQIQGTDTRQVSCIIYLNENWQKDDGGELRLYLPNKRTQEIAPVGGRLVVFLSSEFYHEVLPAKRTRISLTGWFRRRERAVV